MKSDGLLNSLVICGSTDLKWLRLAYSALHTPNFPNPCPTHLTPMSSAYPRRRELLRKVMRKKKIPALLVQKETNVTWLTGFGGEDSILLLMPAAELLITDSRFVTQLAEECPGLELHVRRTGKSSETMDKAVAKVLKKLELTTCGVESDTMTLGLRERIDEAAKASIAWVGTRGMVEELRMIKDKDELAEIRRAVRMAEEAFLAVVSKLHPEQTEREVANALEVEIRLRGGKGHSFEPIVAVGPRSALPHGRAGNTKIGAHNLVLFDWGAAADRYKSDLTRVVVTGKISPKLERIYQVVFKAQAAAIAQIRPGAVCETVDAAARKTIADAGFAKYFGHGLGHGIGMDVHEQPRMASGSKQVLRPGMVITVEPGIYLPGIGGVRIEDDVLVTKSGYEVLSGLPKSWDAVRGLRLAG